MLCKQKSIFTQVFEHRLTTEETLVLSYGLFSTFKYRVHHQDSSILIMNDPKAEISVDGQQVPSASQQHPTIKQQAIHHQNAIQQQTGNIPYNAKRTLAQRRFTRAEKSLTEVLGKNIKDVPKTVFEQRYSELKQIWTEFQLAHDEYIIINLKDADAATVNAEDQIIDNLSKVFSSIEIEVHRKLRDMKIKEQTETTIQVGTPQQPFIKFEGIKFPVFDGNARRYTTWKIDFERYIKPFCSTQQLPLIIKQYLSDSVCRDVENLSEAVDIWERLDKKYGSNQKIVDAIMQEIRCLSVKENDDHSILEFIRTIEHASSDLKRKNLESEMNNTTTVTLIERLLPKKMLLEWVEIATKLQPHEKFEQLLQFLEQWKYRIEYLSSNIRNKRSSNIEFSHNNQRSYNNVSSHSNERSHSHEHSYKKDRCYNNECNHNKNNEHNYNNQQSYHKERNLHNHYSYNKQQYERSEHQSAEKKHKCFIHKSEEHPIWCCRLYQRLPVKERIEIAKAHGACLSCLEIGHTTYECQRGFKCPEAGCNQVHNHLLHE